jgi:hypothetical protein
LVTEEGRHHWQIAVVAVQIGNDLLKEERPDS